MEHHEHVETLQQTKELRFSKLSCFATPSIHQYLWDWVLYHVVEYH